MQRKREGTCAEPLHPSTAAIDLTDEPPKKKPLLLDALLEKINKNKPVKHKAIGRSVRQWLCSTSLLVLAGALASGGAVQAADWTGATKRSCPFSRKSWAGT